MRVLGVISVFLAVVPGATRAFAPHPFPSLTTARSNSATFLFKEAVGRLVGRSRAKKVVEQPAPIKVGEALPENVDVTICGTTTSKEEDEAEDKDPVVNVRDAVGKGKALLIGKHDCYRQRCC
jgi:hypothetical protein